MDSIESMNEVSEFDCPCVQIVNISSIERGLDKRFVQFVQEFVRRGGRLVRDFP